LLGAYKGLGSNRIRSNKEEEVRSKKTKGLTQNVKKGSFCDFKQRTYDYDDVEKKC